MSNTKILTSILENHRLTDEQSEELQKVIYMLNDGRLAEWLFIEVIVDKGEFAFSGLFSNL